jgi:hypothetical protein
MLKISIALLFLFSVNASAQTPEEKADAADQYIDAMELPGKSGKAAMDILNADGFRVCRYVGGLLSSVPKDEPLILCQRHSESKFGCSRAFQVIMKMNWGSGQSTVPEMLKEMPETVQWVTTLCI